jgi:Tfp pilus assembly protein PilN
LIRRHPPILAISVVDGALLCAELSGRGERVRLVQAARFAFPGGATLEKPEDLGRALGAFLREQRFSASHAVIGLPARWVLTQPRDVPPMSDADAASMLRLQAEKLAVSDSSDLTFDYVGRTRADGPSRVLILGTLRSRIDQIERLAAAARLRVDAITATSLALAAALAGDRDDAPLLLLTGGSAEVVWRGRGESRLLQHVPLSMNGHGRSVRLLGSELRRGIALSGVAASRDAVMVDAVGLDRAELDQLADAARLDVRAARTLLPVDDASLTPAVALGVAAGRGLLPADFKRSRLAEPRVRRLGRRSLWLGVIATVVVLFVLFEVIDFQQQRSELAALDEQLQRIAPDVAAAEAAIARTTFGRGFFENRPPALGALAELTAAFGPLTDIWATSFTFRDGGRCQLQGAATDQQTVLRLLDRMKATTTFDNVTLLDLRDAAGAREQEVSFSITFTHREARR